MKKILITGYKGMIGSRLYSYLESLKEYELKGIDIIDNTGDIRTLQSSEKFDIIIHCAALTSVIESIQKPKEYYETNVYGTFNLLNQFPYSKFVFLSTSAIYGEGLNHKELDIPHPKSPYAKSKLDAEYYIRCGAKDCIILRLSNIYGGKKGERNVYQIFEEESILPIYGDGTAVRDYLHVDDLCKIIANNLDKHGIFNIGSGKIKSVLDIAKEFNKPTKFLSPRKGEIQTISLDLSKAKKAKILCI